MTRHLFRKNFVTRFRQADPAGILFFAEAYEIAHDTFEDFLIELGLDWKHCFENREWALPIRHSECQHLAPLHPGLNYTVTVKIEKIGDSSLALNYEIADENRVCAEVKMVHACLNKKTMIKMSIPSEIRSRLETYQSQCLPPK
jgi:acyl-CoA thioesterase FadM